MSKYLILNRKKYQTCEIELAFFSVLTIKWLNDQLKQIFETFRTKSEMSTFRIEQKKRSNIWDWISSFPQIIQEYVQFKKHACISPMVTSLTKFRYWVWSTHGEILRSRTTKVHVMNHMSRVHLSTLTCNIGSIFFFFYFFWKCICWRRLI